MFVKFYHKATLDGTGKDGLPLYRDQVWVIINRDMTHSMDRVMKEEDTRRFPEIYEAFLKATAKHEDLEGYPLEMWSALLPSEVEMFKVRGIRTVQELASASNSMQTKMPAAVKLKVKQARRFIELAGAGAGLTEKAEQLEVENAALKEDLTAARQQISALSKPEVPA